MADDRFDEAWWPMADLALDGGLLRVNDHFADLVGRPVGALVGTSVFDLWSEDELAAEIDLIGGLWRGDAPLFRRRRTLPLPGGGTWQGELLVSLVREDDGTPSRYHVRLGEVPDERRPPAGLAGREGDLPLSLDQVRVGLCIIGLDGVPLRANAALCTIMGRSEDEILTLDLLSTTHPDDRQADIDLGSKAWAGELDSWMNEKRLVRPDGSERWVLQEVTVVRDHDGAMLHLVGQVVDIHDRKTAELALAASREEFRRLYRHVPVGLIESDGEGRVLRANPAAEAIAGEALPPGHDVSALIHPDDRDALYAIAAHHIARGEDYHTEFRVRRRDGTVRWVRTDAHPHLHPDGSFAGFSGTWLDVTELVEARERLRHQATRDPLTGLANRSLCFEVLDEQVATAEAQGGPLSVLFVDLDGFKQVNDRHGHAGGDEALATVAGRLADVVPEGALLARIGGDEFVVACPVDADEACRVGEALVAAASEPVELGAPYGPDRAGATVEVRLGASVGVTTWVPGASADDLVRAADRAVYAVKARGGGAVVVADE